MFHVCDWDDFGWCLLSPCGFRLPSVMTNIFAFETSFFTSDLFSSKTIVRNLSSQNPVKLTWRTFQTPRISTVRQSTQSPSSSRIPPVLIRRLVEEFIICHTWFGEPVDLSRRWRNSDRLFPVNHGGMDRWLDILDRTIQPLPTPGSLFVSLWVLSCKKLHKTAWKWHGVSLIIQTTFEYPNLPGICRGIQSKPNKSRFVCHSFQLIVHSKTVS